MMQAESTNRVMRTWFTRRTGQTGGIRFERSRTNPEMLFVAAAPIFELSYGQTVDLIRTLEQMASEVWPDER